MSTCTDRNFEPLLHAYEIGILEAEDREPMEQHLYECESCMAKAQEFQEYSVHLRHSRAVRDEVRSLAAEQEEGQGFLARLRATWSTPRRRWVTAVPAVSLAIAAVLLLVLVDWDIQIRPSKEAQAFEDRLAVLYFDNLADIDDVDRLGEIVTDLLITGLSQSEQVPVVSSQRLYDIVKWLGQEGEKRIDRETATQIAERARARWMVTGSLVQTEPNLVLTTQLVDVSSGSILGSERIRAERGEDVYALVDRLVLQVQEALPISMVVGEEPYRPVADVTTNSLDAYRHYLEGREYYLKFDYRAAEYSLRKALEFDSTMARAYMTLAICKANQRDPEYLELSAQAVTYSANATRRERWMAEALHAFFTGDYQLCLERGDQLIAAYPDDKYPYLYLAAVHTNRLRHFDSAISLLLRAVEIDPLFRNAYERLAMAYGAKGDYTMALQAINQAIDLAPEEAIPYRRKGDMFAGAGMLDSAIASYEKAIEIQPDVLHARERVGDLYVYRGEYAKARDAYQAVSALPEQSLRSSGRTLLALVPLVQGRLTEALAVLEDGLAADRMENLEGQLDHQQKIFLRSLIHLEQDSVRMAIEEVERAVDISLRRRPDGRDDERLWLLHLLVHVGDTSGLRRLAAELDEHGIAAPNERSRHLYREHAAGALAFVDGESDLAAEHFAAAAESASAWLGTHFAARVTQAHALRAAGKTDAAIQVYEELLTYYTRGRLLWLTWSVKLHYWLGQAYEETGRHRDAIAQYKKFLELWQNADPGIAEVEDARSRLARLKP